MAEMDSAVKALLEKEASLNKECNAVRDSLKANRERRDKIFSDPKSQVAKKLDELEAQIVAALDKKAALYDQLNALRGNTRPGSTGDAQATIVENLSLLRLKRQPYRDQKDEFEADKRAHEKTFRELKSQADRLRLKVPKNDGGKDEVTVQQMKARLQSLDSKIDKAVKANQLSSTEHYRKEKKDLEKSEPYILEYWRLVDQVFEAKTKLAAAEKGFNEASTELKKIEGEMDTLEGNVRGKDERAVQKEEDKAKKEEADKLFAQVKDCGAQIDKLRKQKQTVRDSAKTSNDGGADLNEAIKGDVTKRDALLDELKAIRAQIPSKTIKYDKKYHSDLIGPKGATIQALESDFGVTLNVDFDNGEVTLKGGEDALDECAAAITALLQNAKDSRCEAQVKFNPAIARELIGQGGSNIRRMEEASGARINVDQKTENVTIVGTQASVDKGKEIVEDLLSQCHMETIQFNPAMTDVVVGRGGKTVRRIKEESGARSINIDRSGKLEIMGTKAAVTAAKTEYTELLDSCGSGGLEIKISPDMVGIIVGKGGSNIRKIEEDTGCMVNVNKSGGAGSKGKPTASVNIKGAKAATTKAKKMVDDLLAANARDTVNVPYDTNLRFFLIRPLKDNEEGLCPLEIIKRDSGVQRVEAVRGQAIVAVTGKKENVNEGVRMLKQLLTEQMRDVVKVGFTPVLFGILVNRDGGDTPLDAIRKETECDSINLDKATGKITIIGTTATATAAKTKLQAKLKELDAQVDTVKVAYDRLIPAIIGTAGQTINKLRADFGVEIDVDRDSMSVSVCGEAEGRAKAIAAIEAIMAQEQNGSATE